MPSVYRSVTINTSKETMSFSDFPAPDCFPNYTHSSKLRDYFRMYAKYFGLPKCICLKAPLPAPLGVRISTYEFWEHEHSDRSVHLQQSQDGSGPTEVDAPGTEKFEGCYFHSRLKKSQESRDFLGKRVMVVGCGNSGVDIAVELGHGARPRSTAGREDVPPHNPGDHAGCVDEIASLVPFPSGPKLPVQVPFGLCALYQYLLRAGEVARGAESHPGPERAGPQAPEDADC